MHVILFGLGLFLSAAGLAVAAYGFREIEFTIGTTLILAGTIAGTGGLLLIGLAAVVHKLRLIARLQTPQSVREVEAAEAPMPASARSVPMPTLARIPFPPRPQTAEAKPARAPEPRASEVRASELRAPEPRVEESDLDMAPDPLFDDMLGRASVELPPEPRIEPRVEPRLEPRAPQSAPQSALQPAPQMTTPSRLVEPPMVDDHDEVPLSPRPPAKVTLRHQPAPPLTRVRAEPRPGNGNGTASSSAEEPEADAAEAGQPPVNFDALWPAEKRPGRMSRENPRAAPAPAVPFVERRGEAARRDVVRPEPPRRNEEAAQDRSEATRSEPPRVPSSRVEPPALRVEPTPVRAESAPVRHEPYVPGTEPPALRIESEQPLAAPAAKSAEPPRAVAILKSGVVDGMAYTLYADGSIEAQLPAGTLRFGSIAELREHIEKNS